MSYTTSPPKRSLQPGGDTETRADRARVEPMAVAPLGGGRYDVISRDDHVYTVSLPEGRCTCPDYRHRGVRCKHLRRVAIEVTAGRTPPPGRVAVPCALCGTETFVDEDAPPPHFCAVHALEPGDAARDRETGRRVLVVSVSDRRADEVTLDPAGTTVADYPTNGDYSPGDPVIGGIYPGVRMAADGPRPPELKVYSFPASRLERLAD